MKLYKKHGYKTSRVLLNIKSVVIALKMAITDFMLNTPYSAKHYVCSIIYIMLNNKYSKRKAGTPTGLCMYYGIYLNPRQ